MHIIQKSKIQFDFIGNDRNGSIEFFGSITREKILPELEVLFDKITKKGKHLIIDRLQLDLGSFQLYELEESISARLTDVGMKELSQMTENSQDHHLQLPVPSSSNIGHYKKLNSTSSINDQNQSNFYFLSDEDLKMEVFSFFMETGRLPWWQGKQDIQDFENNITKSILINPDKLNQVLSILSDKSSLLRFINQHSDSFLEWAWQTVFQSKIKSNELYDFFASAMKKKLFKKSNQLLSKHHDIHITQELGNKFIDIFKVGVEDSDNRNGYWEKTFQLLFLTEKEIVERFIFVLIQDNISFQSTKDTTSLKKHQIKEILDKSIAESDNNKLEQAISKGVDYLLQQNWNDSDLNLKTNRGSDLKSLLGNKGREKSYGLECRENELKGNEELFINNAGLILLHPFYYTLFKELGFLAEKEFTTTKNRIKAAHLLQFISTGETECYEFDLVLNKILCGIEPDISIDRFVEITDTEMRASEEMMNAAIKHWKELGNTSIDGLRNEFLLRTGKLSKLNDHEWEMDVESKTHDILITRLPWSISIIKLPWSEQLIKVNWN